MNPINSIDELKAITFSREIELEMQAKISTQEKEADQFEASVTLAFRFAPGMNGLELMKRACKDMVIAFANKNRPKGAAHLRAIHGKRILVDLIPVNARAEAVPDEGKAIDVLIAAKKAGKLTLEQERQLQELFTF